MSLKAKITKILCCAITLGAVQAVNASEVDSNPLQDLQGIERFDTLRDTLNNNWRGQLGLNIKNVQSNTTAISSANTHITTAEQNISSQQTHLSQVDNALKSYDSKLVTANQNITNLQKTVQDNKQDTSKQLDSVKSEIGDKDKGLVHDVSEAKRFANDLDEKYDTKTQGLDKKIDKQSFKPEDRVIYAHKGQTLADVIEQAQSLNPSAEHPVVIKLAPIEYDLDKTPNHAIPSGIIFDGGNAAILHLDYSQHSIQLKGNASFINLKLRHDSKVPDGKRDFIFKTQPESDSAEFNFKFDNVYIGFKSPEDISKISVLDRERLLGKVNLTFDHVVVQTAMYDKRWKHDVESILLTGGGDSNNSIAPEDSVKIIDSVVGRIYMSYESTLDPADRYHCTYGKYMRLSAYNSSGCYEKVIYNNKSCDPYSTGQLIPPTDFLGSDFKSC